MTELEILLTDKVAVLENQAVIMAKLSATNDKIIAIQDAKINKLTELMATRERIELATHNLIQNLR